MVSIFSIRSLLCTMRHTRCLDGCSLSTCCGVKCEDEKMEYKSMSRAHYLVQTVQTRFPCCSDGWRLNSTRERTYPSETRSRRFKPVRSH